MADAAALAQSAAETLLGDETLRGDLTDDGFGPLLDWALAALKAAAARAAALPDAEAEAQMSAATERVRATLEAAVQAAQGHTRADLLALLRAPLPALSGRTRSLLALAGFRLGDDADANAVRLAKVLRNNQ